MKLVDRDTGREIKVGDELTSFRGEKYYAHYFREPDHGEGKISVVKNKDDLMSCAEYYVGVFNLVWYDDDRPKVPDAFTDLVSTLIYGGKVRGYSYLSITDIRELYRVWQQMNCGNRPEFINANVKRVLDKFKIPTREKGNGWEVA